MEENKKNMFIAVAYNLYTVDDGKEEFVEEATTDNPYTFLSGFGMVLPAFEDAVMDKQKSEKFEILIDKEQAYGEHDDAAVVELARDVFTIDGHFDTERIFEGAMVPLMNEEGQRFQASVVKVDETNVTVDLNYPLAGKSLKFVGHVIENREATNAEIEMFVARMSGEGGCSCGSGCNCGDGGCSCGGDSGADCGCGGCH
ncbi:MAG: FKBP-type peptidyl-prolyl cis-trans isomerase [Prevotella sp.]|uniref:FKBP-type peptidyl-prolyl cis-trans isomerase n=1 Tax=Prevotella sp. TaxID=59823 RepID=UPI002A317B76|nr:FKBP-type peptidyl-prolyl cis-trans isomerase [Prevotella sp.]MDD7317617.1 FKBP-type peptidyl-prolyl cis-trans isomerase [Prevotellaceae bacterium]MDY4020536.1 FKBP-type peptidyl-prolyl cis-trans isomerase [Prevotella sp.]